jgi:hypothetical protein
MGWLGEQNTQILMAHIHTSIAASAVMVAIGLLPAAPAVAGQIIYAHNPGPYSTSSNLDVMNDDGTDQRVLIPDNTYQGITDATQPNLLPGTTDLAFSASGPAAAGSPGALNAVGVYTLIGGMLRRISPPIQNCTGFYPVGNCSSETDQDPTLTADGQVVYEHNATDTGITCFYYCGIYANAASAYYEQPANGTGTAKQWPIPNGALSGGNYQPNTDSSSFYAPPFADPGDAAKIAYAGLEDYNCTPVDSCDPVTVDTKTGSGAYNITDADCNASGPGSGCLGSNSMSVLGWSPGGKYILVAFGSGSSAQGVWLFKNQPYVHSGSPSSTPIQGTGWWVWEPTPSSTIGQGGTITSDTPGQGQIIFTYNGDIVSIPGSCWGGTPTTSTHGSITPTCTHGTELTQDGQDSWPTWTSATGTIAVGAAPLSTVVRVRHGATSASALIRCSTGIGDCADALGLATIETLHGSKIVAVSAVKTTHKAVVVGSTSVQIPAGTSETVTVALNGLGRRLLARFHKLPTLLLVLQGKSTVAAVKVTFRTSKSKHH